MDYLLSREGFDAQMFYGLFRICSEVGRVMFVSLKHNICFFKSGSKQKFDEIVVS